MSAHRDPGHGGTAGQVAETVDLKRLQEACWGGFCGAINYFIRGNQFTDKLIVNFQGKDCRIMEANTDGTCLVDVPGGEPQNIGLKDEDCYRLLAVCCNIPPGQLKQHAGGSPMRT